MRTWTADELDRVGSADELEVSSVRGDGTDRPFVTIWVVRAGDALYVRSAYTAQNPWYRRALRAGTGRIRAGGAEHAVTFTRIAPDDAAVQETIDAAYHAKYDRYGRRLVATVVGATAQGATLRLDPR